MSGPSFTSPPAAEAEEMSRIHYEMAYTEDISQRMRIPETLKVAAAAAACVQQQQQQQPPPHAHSALMQVPERIVVAAADGDPRLSCPRDLDLIQSVPATAELLDMKAPPRVLTLSRQPLDSLETRQISKSDPAHAAPSRSGRERGAGEMASARHSGQVIRGDVSVTPSPSAPLVRMCPPLCSPEDADVNLMTAAGFLTYVRSATRRAYRQFLQVLDDSQRRSHPDLASDVTPDEFGLADASSLRRS
ncbi:mitochondrial fission factor homolog A-like isoform X3 [Corythoichthys intestinalis]|uniref:mitochondrial fission factor homolog A-like isoform X3 n=1 Tax=Corythoichthys intestinalis TaxID=161448 RepID=UPI0025A4FAA2|nr:mitochondrial fission factor homolog A-like isoform X3 [Corythoichthys intestinalis]